MLALLSTVDLLWQMAAGVQVYHLAVLHVQHLFSAHAALMAAF